MKGFLSLLFKVGFAGLLIYWLINHQGVDFSRLSTLLNFKDISVLLFITFLNLFICSERWRGILKSQGFKLSLVEGLKFTFIGLFFNFAIPGGVGGDVVKGYYISKKNPTSRLKAIMTLAIDRIFGLFSMVMMALFTMIFYSKNVAQTPHLKTIFLSLCFVFISMMIFWSIAFSRRIYNFGLLQKIITFLPFSEKLSTIFETISAYRNNKKAFFVAVFQSLIAQSISILFFVYLGKVLNFEISISNYFFVVPVGFIITAIPISPAGVGVGQAAFFFLFNLISVDSAELGPLGITMQQIILLFFGLIGAYFYIFIRRHIKLSPTLSNHP